jgi:hypothetical protein
VYYAVWKRGRYTGPLDFERAAAAVVGPFEGSSASC